MPDKSAESQSGADDRDFERVFFEAKEHALRAQRRVILLFVTWVAVLLAGSGILWYSIGKFNAIESSVAAAHQDVTQSKKDIEGMKQVFEGKLSDYQNKLTSLTKSLEKSQETADHLKQSLAQFAKTVEQKDLQQRVTSLTKELETLREKITDLNKRTSGFSMSENHAVMTTGDSRIQLLLVPSGDIVLRKYDDLKTGKYHQQQVSVIK
jgi:uncharacterized protein YukE